MSSPRFCSRWPAWHQCLCDGLCPAWPEGMSTHARPEGLPKHCPHQSAAAPAVPIPALPGTRALWWILSLPISKAILGPHCLEQWLPACPGHPSSYRFLGLVQSPRPCLGFPLCCFARICCVTTGMKKGTNGMGNSKFPCLVPLGHFRRLQSAAQFLFRWKEVGAGGRHAGNAFCSF